MGLVDNLETIQTTLYGATNSVKSAIVAKGGTVTNLASMPAAIANLPTGGGMPEVSMNRSDYTRLTPNETYTAERDGWLLYTIFFDFDSYTDCTIYVNGSIKIWLLDNMDSGLGYVSTTGVYPIHAGETFYLSSDSFEGVLEIRAFLGIRYLQ